MNQIQKLHPLSIVLHWAVAILVISLITVGIYMAENEAWAFYPIHKSFGIIAFLVILARVVWRVKNGWPTPVRQYEKVEQLLSRITHWVLIIGSVVMPISGMLFSGASGHGFGVFGIPLFPSNHNPSNPQEVVPFNEGLMNFGHEVHEIVGFILIAAILLHLAGALKHHIFDKDATLRRMLGKSV